eukprot:682603-Prymnesium_polylepis.1
MGCRKLCGCTVGQRDGRTSMASTGARLPAGGSPLLDARQVTSDRMADRLIRYDRERDRVRHGPSVPTNYQGRIILILIECTARVDVTGSFRKPWIHPTDRAFRR